MAIFTLNRQIDMKRLLFLIVLSAVCLYGKSFGGFISSGGFQNNTAFVLNDVVSGVVEEKGVTIYHGSLPLLWSSEAAVELISDLWADDDAVVSVFSVDGKFAGKFRKSELDVSCLEKGVYILKGVSSSIKLIVP